VETASNNAERKDGNRKKQMTENRAGKVLYQGTVVSVLSPVTAAGLRYNLLLEDF